MSFRKCAKTNKANAVTIYTRIKEHLDVFCIENSLLFCNYCDLSVEWRYKSTQSLETTLFAVKSKSEIVEKGEAIPQAPTLHQLYLPSVFKNRTKTLLSIFNSKPVCIIMDKLSDDCARSVVNTLFAYRQDTKLVSVNFLQRVNNITIEQTLHPFYILTIYLLIFHVYFYLIKSPYILNLIGETWRDFSQFLPLKTFLAKIKESFVKSSA
ncbi:20905_t:CDS:2 [Rhizophagus irregularis]|nr:20905_t:CDS:2 [Rhizophagus irregularis]